MYVETGAALALQCSLVCSAAEGAQRSLFFPPTTPSTLHLIYVSSQRLSADLVLAWAPVPLSALRTEAFHYNSSKKPTEIRNKTEPILSLFRLLFNCLVLHFPNYIFLLIWPTGKQRQQYFHQNQGSGDGR